MGITPLLVAVPGNHDCDFSHEEATVRDTIVNDIIKNQYLTINDSHITFCRKVQGNYDNFIKQYCVSETTDINGLLKIVKINLKDYELNFSLLKILLGYQNYTKKNLNYFFR